jgi:hypothetical protein
MPLGAKILLDPNIEEQYGMVDIIPDCNVYGEYKINTKSSPLLLRDKPDTNADIIVEMPKGRTIFCYGFTDITMEWYLCEYSDSGKIYAGFCNKKYLTKKKKRSDIT